VNPKYKLSTTITIIPRLLIRPKSPRFWITAQRSAPISAKTAPEAPAEIAGIPEE
jgi:hypothetical protein